MISSPASATAQLCLAQPLPYPPQNLGDLRRQDPVAALAGAAASSSPASAWRAGSRCGPRRWIAAAFVQ